MNFSLKCIVTLYKYRCKKQLKSEQVLICRWACDYFLWLLILKLTA